MKRIIFITLFFIVQLASAQSLTLEEAVAKSTETMPENIQANYPHLYSSIINEKASDEYIKKIYFGSFEGTQPVRMIHKSGVIIFDIAYFMKSNVEFDSRAVWMFYTQLGVLHFMKEINSSPSNYEGQKSKFYFAMGKTLEMANKGYCQPLKFGLGVIFFQRTSLDENIKKASQEIINDNFFKNCADIIKMKGCPFAYSIGSSNNEISTNSTQNITNQNVVQEKVVIDVNEATKNLRADVDSYQKVTRYYSSKTPKDINDEDRFFAYIIRWNNGELNLRILISHVAVEGRNYLEFGNVASLADDKVYYYNPQANEIKNNNYRHSWADVSCRNRPSNYAAIDDIIKSDKTTVRFFAGNIYNEFKVSSKEKKALLEIKEAFIALGGKWQ